MLMLFSLMAILSLTVYSISVYTAANTLETVTFIVGMTVILVFMVITYYKRKDKRVFTSVLSILAALTLSNQYEKLILMGSSATFYPLLSDSLLLLIAFAIGMLISGVHLPEMKGIKWSMVFLTICLPILALLNGKVNGDYIALPGGILLSPVILFAYVFSSAFLLTKDAHREMLGVVPKGYIVWSILSLIVLVELVICRELSTLLAMILIGGAMLISAPRHVFRDLSNEGKFRAARRWTARHKGLIIIGIVILVLLGVAGLAHFVQSNSEKIDRIIAWLSWKENINDSYYASVTLKSFRVLLLNIKRAGLYGLGSNFTYLLDSIPTMYTDFLLIKYLLENGIVFTLAFLITAFTMCFMIFYAASRCQRPYLRLLNSGLAFAYLIVLLLHCCSNLCTAPILGITTITGDGTSFTIVFGICFGIAYYSLSIEKNEHCLNG